MSQGATKVCRFCQADVASRARIKDKKGRYACQPCFEKLKAKQEQARQITEPKANPYSAFAPDIDTESISMEVAGATAQQARTMPCPSCKATMGAGDVFCVNCGTNVQTGGQLGKAKVKKAKARRQSSVNTASVLIWISILIAVVVGVCMAIGSQQGEDSPMLLVSLLMFVAYISVIGISTLVVACKQSGVVKMLLVWFVPLYVLFWMYGECESRLLKWNFSLSLLLYIPYFMALKTLGGLGP